MEQSKVYNDYDFGGYLIERHIPTFIDGRAVVFGDLFKSYFDAHSYPALLKDIDWLLIKPWYGPPEVDWQKVYCDEIACVWTRKK